MVIARFWRSDNVISFKFHSYSARWKSAKRWDLCVFVVIFLFHFVSWIILFHLIVDIEKSLWMLFDIWLGRLYLNEIFVVRWKLNKIFYIEWGSYICEKGFLYEFWMNNHDFSGYNHIEWDSQIYVYMYFNKFKKKCCEKMGITLRRVSYQIRDYLFPNFWEIRKVFSEIIYELKRLRFDRI